MEQRERVISDHWYLCRRAARRFLRPGLDRCDLEQVAAIGLIKAADRYDDAYATPFEAYAWVLMLGELMHFVRDAERLLRAPRRIRDLERRCVAAERELRTVLRREPHEADVARHMNLSSRDQREIREYRASNRVASFDALSVVEHRSGQESFDAVLDRMTIDRALGTLSPLERRIVAGIHLEGMTVVEMAKRLGYSRRHVTRLHRGAIARLRNAC
ncbi:MAG: sigma-70 family RNA polymerase sigma factor [Candidatus Eremiobacteraeota bacterium]|nr:sigma-70 family RNA polymerase sigma factor [Candidatus Eremiobacteraeota bacterium]MBV8375155.1 sigma-70 family RNA polymerase sigma factor [Candidatus Eremiobacteraeota bacterium]